ncbi:MAG: Holliday junction DNA helicase RuvB C-terminal domain-containing protein [Phycisphaerae bacterium]|nr:Holliday junction DNA helicase RuvB C-terminal domain-containing protein [Phycisphaerae bacterium]
MVPTIDHFIGQQDVIARFRVALEAAWQDGTRLPHMLFVGPPGVGKTELAHVAAREMGVEIHERIAQTLMSPGSVNALLLGAADKEIVFVDEVHELFPTVQTTLYRAMEDGMICVEGRDDDTYNMPLKSVTILAATTDEYALLPPLRDRFKLILPFTHYDNVALTQITLQRAAWMHIHLDQQVAEEIAARSRGTPRLVIRLLEACHRFARSKGDAEVTTDHFVETVKLEGLDSLGLDRNERRYLRYLADRHEPTQLSTLESFLGIHRRTIQSVIEPFLLRCGLIEKTDKGRLLTAAGMRHLGLVAENKEQTVNGPSQ